MPSSEHTTNVNVEDNVKFGVFANAFRVVEEVGPDCLLDFMVYSAAEQEATVVARVRVHKDFLEGIRDKLGDAMETFGDDDGLLEGVSTSRKATKPVH